MQEDANYEQAAMDVPSVEVTFSNCFQLGFEQVYSAALHVEHANAFEAEVVRSVWTRMDDHEDDAGAALFFVLTMSSGLKSPQLLKWIR